MTHDKPGSEQIAPVHPLARRLLAGLVETAGAAAQLVGDDQSQFVAVEETTSRITVAEAEGDELRIVPYVGSALPDVPSLRIGPSYAAGKREIAMKPSELVDDPASREAVVEMLRAALEYWVALNRVSRPVEVPEPARPETAATATELEPVLDNGFDVLVEATVLSAPLQLRADVSAQWSWASSAARIPQVTDIVVTVIEPLPHVRISISVVDGDVQFGSTVAHDGALAGGTTIVPAVHVPLSASVMSRVEERRAARCVIEARDTADDRVLARLEEDIDIQPRDLWFWGGDPRRSEQRARLVRRHDEVVDLLAAEPDGPGSAELVSERNFLRRFVMDESDSLFELSQALLASFVRPNHPEVSSLAREAASYLERATHSPAFNAFQLPDLAAAEQRADDTIDAIYAAVRAREIAYSEPPPGWDYRTAGQRIRDHEDVARGGLGTCMDTTVLIAAVIEQVGLYPVLVAVPGHIFIGYWRRDPFPATGAAPQWYPDAPLVSDGATVERLVQGNWLGLLETTVATAGSTTPPAQARAIPLQKAMPDAISQGAVRLIDVAAARRAGVSPLPAVHHREDGVTEVIEYRPGGPAAVTQVDSSPLPSADPQRTGQEHPVRYRTWKSSLFSLNATNDLLNLKRNARVQPLVLPPEALGPLEDKLNQDVSFSLHSGHDVPEVWRARGTRNAVQLLDSNSAEDRSELRRRMDDRHVYVQRIGVSRGTQAAVSDATFVRELRSMAHQAKVARDERGMNPLYLCLGLLRWPYKDGVMAEAPLILVPVNLKVTRGRHDFTLSLDASQQTTPNAALMEWLRREHGLTIPGLVEPLTDKAGIDVDGVLAEVRRAVTDAGLPLDVTAEARLAMLDLSAFRMWQDLNQHADAFLERPLVQHLVHTPTADFIDPLVASDAPTAVSEDQLDQLETPIPADSTQKRAVLWAREGRTFVLQGPPGTGKSQTITNMVGECLLAGLKVLFVAEKGTALSVVQRRLESVGLGPFTLNLHHEGSNAAQVRAQLKRSLTATVQPDPTAMENSRRKLRSAQFELTRYPQQLHDTNAAGLSAYTAQDQLLLQGDGPVMPLPRTLVAHQPEQVDLLRGMFADLQRWTSSAGVRPDHPWRLAGPVEADAFDVAAVTAAVTGALDGLSWAQSVGGALREVLDRLEHPLQIETLAAAADPTLPTGEELTAILGPTWQNDAEQAIVLAQQAVQSWGTRMHGFSHHVLELDLARVDADLKAANDSGFLGRKKRVAAAVEQLRASAPSTLDLASRTSSDLTALVEDLLAVQRTARQITANLGVVPGVGRHTPEAPFSPDAFSSVRARLEALVAASSALRSEGSWGDRVRALAIGGELRGQKAPLAAYAGAWRSLTAHLQIRDPDLAVWRGARPLAETVLLHADDWRRDVEWERLVALQRWCALVVRVEPLLAAGLDDARSELLDGRLPADAAEEMLTRGIARASLEERISAVGMDRFDAVAHDERVMAYSRSQEQVREQWVTDAPARLLAARGSGGRGAHTGGLARELEKTRGKLGTRPILRKYGSAVQELTPLVLCSPSSVVDLIEPGSMEFDVVIFDEASQITVPEAVGALGRAKAAIVVGDKKQMPPTRKVGGPTGDDEMDDDAEEIVEDQESILSECELARVPTLSLSWHYRSQDEALIAFSNRAYYGGELSSFPTPTLLSSETGVELRRVPGQYLRAGSDKVGLKNGVEAGNNTNPIEAAAIVDEVHRLVHETDKLPSIGVVTFNEPQRQLIEDLLLTSTDERVAEVMSETTMGRGDVLFVKALEQVQGDERDTVVFSIAFSKQANGKIPTNFGPLSNVGGERRLNVAVTRARRKNVVFCSFDPQELEVAGSAYQGPRDLKDFLVFAKGSGGVSATDDPAARTAIRDRHRDDIAEALRQAGLHVMSDVGLSNFRLDLVLSRVDQPERPLLPVLLDGESWRLRSTVSDRDVLPVEVLENLMGWPTVARVWWPMWLQNREEVVSRLLAEVDRADSALADRAPTVTVAPVADQATDETYDSDSRTLSPAESGGDHQSPHRMTAGVLEPVRSDDEAPELAGSSTTADPVPSEDPVPTPDAASDGPGPGAHADRSLDDSISEFRPASVEVVGPRDVLDALPDPAASHAVRQQLLDIIETEGPVQAARLTRQVAKRFGLGTVRSSRADAIARFIPADRLRTSPLGVFAWPSAMDPDTWAGFRYAESGGSRTIDEIAPEEITNAMLAVIAEYDGLSHDGVMRRTAELFGISRLGANVRSRLEQVATALVLPRLEQADDTADAGPLALDEEQLLVEFRQALVESASGSASVGRGYLQWAGDAQIGLWVELGDGASFDAPFDPDLAAILVQLGWQPPSDDSRNCWLEVPTNGLQSPEEVDQRLRSAAGIVVAGADALAGRH